jgi:Thiol-disulfide isomerase and thioredoxins
MFARIFPVPVLLSLVMNAVPAQALELGAPAPAFELPVLGAEESAASLTLESLRGKVLYVDFWASWCAPCRFSMPLLDALRKELQSEGAAFEVVAVNVDERIEDARSFLQQIPVSYLVVRDASGATPSAYELQGMPTGFLLDAHGQIRLIHPGFKRDDIDLIEAEARQLLRENSR